MKNLIVFLLSIFTFQTFANEMSYSCDLFKPVSTFSATVVRGDIIYVETHAFMSGHIWSSENGIEGVVTNPASLGGLNTVLFSINTANQKSRKKTYTFIFKRPWEHEIVSECNISVTVR